MSNHYIHPSSCRRKLSHLRVDLFYHFGTSVRDLCFSIFSVFDILFNELCICILSLLGKFVAVVLVFVIHDELIKVRMILHVLADDKTG